MQGGALARAVGADEADDAAFVDAEVDAVEGYRFAVVFAQTARFNAGHRLGLPCGLLFVAERRTLGSSPSR